MNSESHYKNGAINKPFKVTSPKEKQTKPFKVSSSKWKAKWTHKIKHKKELNTRLEKNKKHIKTLSDKELTNDQINLLGRGLKYILHPWQTKYKLKGNTCVTSISLQEECVYDTFFTGKTTNLTLSTLNLRGMVQ